MTNKRDFQGIFLSQVKKIFWNQKRQVSFTQSFFSTYAFLAIHIFFKNQVNGVHPLWSKANSTFKREWREQPVWMLLNPAWSVLSSSGCKEKVLCFRGKSPHMSATRLQGELSRTKGQKFHCLLCHFSLLNWSLSIMALHWTVRYVWNRVIDVGYSSLLSIH